MALESANYLDGLASNNPLATISVQPQMIISG